MSNKLTRSDLYSLEAYHDARAEFRHRVMAHKANRRVLLGAHASLYFEDRLTIQYQIQEMLRVERIFEADAIEEELSAYTPLIPDGENLKATFMLEYEDESERRLALTQLRGIEDCIWMAAEGHPRVTALADEDLERSNDQKTSAVHFLRFQFSPAAIGALQNGASLSAGIDHDAYQHQIDPLPAAIRDALVADFDPVSV